MIFPERSPVLAVLFEEIMRVKDFPAQLIRAKIIAKREANTVELVAEKYF